MRDIPLRISPFSLNDRWLIWPRMRLYADRLKLTAWFLGGRYRRIVSLSDVSEARVADNRLVLHLEDGSCLRIEVDAPKQWASAIATHRDVQEGCQ